VSSKEARELLFRVGASRFTSFEDYTKKYGLTDAAEALGIFEHVRLLLEQNLIVIRLVDRLFDDMIATRLEKLEPVMDGTRKALRQPYASVHLEYLHHRMRVYGASDQWKKDHNRWK
jgi:hypothetical protein